MGRIENRNGKNYLICCLYRRPSSDFYAFNDYLNELLSFPAVSHTHVFILNDFNINLLNYTLHTATNNYVNTLSSKQFFPYVIHPSLLSETSSTLIDNMFSNITDNETIRGKILTHITYHFPQFLIVKYARFRNLLQKSTLLFS